MSNEFVLQLLNGAWAIVSASLMVICAMYLQHETRARHILPFGERRRLTDGMRVAIAACTMSLGVFLRSIETWRWRMAGRGLDDLSQPMLQAGGLIAVIGFLCLIRELSHRLYGRGPWATTLLALGVFIAISLIGRML